jgi:uncharacterized protein YbbK (DUF523 family)
MGRKQIETSAGRACPEQSEGMPLPQVPGAKRPRYLASTLKGKGWV